MKSEHWLSVSLLLALCSNASLLLLLTYRAVNFDNGAANTCGEQQQQQQQQQLQQQQQQPRVCQPPVLSQTRRNLPDRQTTEQGARPQPPELFLQSRHLNKLSADKTFTILSRDEIRRASTLASRKDGSSKQSRMWRAYLKSVIGGSAEKNTFAPESYDKAIENILSRQIRVFLGMYDRLSKVDPNVFFSKDLPRKNSRFYSSQTGVHVNSNKTDKVASLQFESKDSGIDQSVGKTSPTDRILRDVQNVGPEEKDAGGDTGFRDREKRDTGSAREAVATGNYLNYEYQFSKLLMSKDIEKFSSSVGQLLIPSLIHFEEWVIRLVEELHFAMLSHDLRLERVEKALLNLAATRDADSGRDKRRGDQWQESPQSDALDNLTNDVEDVLLFPDDAKGYPGNISLELEVLEGGDSSGDSEINSTRLTESTSTTPTNSSSSSNNNTTAAENNTTITTTTTTSTSTSTTSTTTTTTQPPTQPIAYYDLLREMQEMKHKVLALENYNTMSDSELTRVRSEVTRMDDKVIEMQRRQKNANAIASMHTFKITELEMAMKRTDVALNMALDSYGRLTSRVTSFKDRLTDFSREVHAVTVHFSRHEQISNELRSADSYKAHDILELRKSMLGLETRVNELYSILDMSMDTVRTDFRAWLDRLCFNNKLAC